MFNLLRSSMNQQLFKRNFCNQSSYYNYGRFNESHHMPNTKSTLFIDEWYTKEGRDNSPLHCMYSGMAKGTSWAEAMLNSEKIKPIALAIVELRKSEGRQAGS